MNEAIIYGLWFVSGAIIGALVLFTYSLVKHIRQLRADQEITEGKSACGFYQDDESWPDGGAIDG